MLISGIKTGDSYLLNKVAIQHTLNIHVIIGSYEKTLTKEEQIRKLEEELTALNAKKYSRTSEAYGAGNNLEAYPMTHLNKTKNPDLMPCPRRPPGKRKAPAE